MIYLDTSFLTPLFRAEAITEKIERFLSRQPAGELAVSHWTRVEFASVMAREVRMGLLDASVASALLAEFESMVDASLHLLAPTPADFKLAHSFVANFATGLRGPDALHLAIARNNAVAEILTLDEGMLLAAKVLKIRARRGIR